jgi:hypothetical protein
LRSDYPEYSRDFSVRRTAESSSFSPYAVVNLYESQGSSGWTLPAMVEV